MLRVFLFLSALFAFAPVACGDGTSKPAATSTAADASPALPTPTVEPPLPTPTPAADTASAVIVVSSKGNFRPTVAEFRQLPQVDVTANGPQKGVSIAALAAKVGVTPTSGFVTIQGIRSDGKRAGIVRYAVADVASSTILVLDDKGHLNLVSSTIPPAEWLTAVESVAFS
jgi:hypothetical protein